MSGVSLVRMTALRAIRTAGELTALKLLFRQTGPAKCLVPERMLRAGPVQRGSYEYQGVDSLMKTTRFHFQTFNAVVTRLISAESRPGSR